MSFYAHALSGCLVWGRKLCHSYDGFLVAPDAVEEVAMFPELGVADAEVLACAFESVDLTSHLRHGHLVDFLGLVLFGLTVVLICHFVYPFPIVSLSLPNIQWVVKH